MSIAATISICALPRTVTAQTNKLFCVLVPHFKDEYWLSVGFGLEQEAAARDIDLVFFEAGGYPDHRAQIDQLSACATRNADAVLIGAVSSDHPDLIHAIGRAAQTMPVFGLVNELHATDLSGSIGVDWHDMGYVLGDHLRLRHPARTPPATAIFLTGPAGAGWTGPLEQGIRDGLAGSAVTILEVFRADTGLRQQLALTELALERHPEADYLIGSAPAVEAAIGLLANGSHKHPPQLLATYVSHTIKRGLMNGSVSAASFDDPVLQRCTAIRLAASASSMQEQPPEPMVTLLTTATDTLEDIEISPAGYFPRLQ